MTSRARLLIVLAMLTAALVVGSLRLFVWPPVDPPGRADAVLVFAGGDGERQAEGARLVRSGVAPVLVVSDGGDAPRHRPGPAGCVRACR
jgi:hypothetical protein